MNDSTLFTLGMFAVTSLAGPVILLILFLTGRAAVRRGKDGARPGGPPRPVAQFGCGLLLLVPVCAFGGIMVASAGGAIHPPLVTVAAPYVCDGTVEAQSRNYSYKPGQQGVARTIFCLDPNGGRRDITLRAVGAASLYYTLILLPAALLLWGLVRLLKPRRPGDGQAAGTRTSYLNQRLRIDADIVRRRAGGIDDRLRRLQALRDGGLISEEDYQARKSAILDEL